MFVIRRKIGQSIRIGDDIVIEILDATPNRVKLGVQAPPAVRVIRSEVLVAAEQNRQAARGPALDSLSALAAHFRTAAPPAEPRESLHPAGRTPVPDTSNRP